MSEYTASADKRPSAKQIYCMAHQLCDIAGIKWPESRADASAIIQQLRDQASAVDAVGAGTVAPPEADSVPF